MINYRHVGLALGIGAATGAALVMYFRPPVTKVEIKEREVVRNDVRTITRTIERPDGTKETISDTVDKSKSSNSKVSSETIVMPKNWLISAGASMDYRLVAAYELHAQRRILGPIYGGITADTTGRVGLSIGMEF